MQGFDIDWFDVLCAACPHSSHGWVGAYTCWFWAPGLVGSQSQVTSRLTGIYTPIPGQIRWFIHPRNHVHLNAEGRWADPTNATLEGQSQDSNYKRQNCEQYMRTIQTMCCTSLELITHFLWEMGKTSSFFPGPRIMTQDAACELMLPLASGPGFPIRNTLAQTMRCPN